MTQRIQPPRRALLALLAAAGTAPAQSTTPAVFVANNGNLDGSISSFRLNPDVSLAFAGVADANTNAYSIDLSPDGTYLAVGRASEAEVNEQLRIFRVNDDATLTQVLLTLVPETPLDVQWLSDDLLAVLQTNIEANLYNLRTFHFDGETFQQADVLSTGGFTSSIAAAPGLPFLYTGRSFGGSQVRAYAFDQDGNLDLVQQLPTPTYPLDLTLSPDATTLYAAGGISNGQDKVAAYTVDRQTGFLTPLPGSPFTSPGDSPAHLAISPDNALLFVGHGADASIHSFFINPDGSIAPTGHSFDVGQQGTLGDIATAPGLLYATDNSTISDGLQGVYVFEVNPADGSFQWEGPVYSTQGVAPDAIVTWTPAAPPACPGDADADGDADSADLNIVLASFGQAVTPGQDGDVNSDGQVNSEDLNAVLAAFGTAC